MTPQVSDPKQEPLKSALESLRESEEFKVKRDTWSGHEGFRVGHDY